MLRPARVAAATVFATLGFAGAASADPLTVTGGHWDIAAEFNCDTEEFEGGLHAHNEDSDIENPVADTTFKVTGTSNSVWETNVIGTAPVKVIGDAGTYRVGFAIERLDDNGEPAECDTPALRLATDWDDISGPGHMAAYTRTGATSSPIETLIDNDPDAATDPNLNQGVAVDESADDFHIDPRWGFRTNGTYTVPLTATFVDPATSQTVTLDTETLTFLVANS
jgi:hypothetical protein